MRSEGTLNTEQIRKNKHISMQDGQSRTQKNAGDHANQKEEDRPVEQMELQEGTP
jgi:hypothetical protein